MNKKYLNSTLIVLLIVIWGGVFYKYFGGKKHSDGRLNVVSSISNYKHDYTVAKDTFQLKLIDRDPFGVHNKFKRKSKVKTRITKPKKNIKQKVKKNIVWPTITYHGFVKGEHNATRLILVKINNKLYRKREQQTVEDITLTKAYNDSLIVSLNKNTKTIKKIND